MDPGSGVDAHPPGVRDHHADTDGGRVFEAMEIHTPEIGEVRV